MALFFVQTAKGLEEVLQEELKSLGIHKSERKLTGVRFEGSWEDCYKVNLHSRIATRVLLPVHDFTAGSPEDLYEKVRGHDFTQYIDVKQTIAIEAVVKDCEIHDQRLVAMKIKDAIVDQFRDKFGSRPDVSKTRPHLKVYVRAVRNIYSLSVDTSGKSLFMRGYREEKGEAPIKENLAAALLHMSGWDKKSPLIDPMCGSGTFLIEAALMAKNIAPGTLRKEFGFQHLLNYDRKKWEKIVDEALSQENHEVELQLFGYDADRKVVGIANENAKKAGVDEFIQFKRAYITVFKPPCEMPGMIIVNPPYGVRLGEEDDLKDVYRDFAFSLKQHFKGWSCWIISGNKDLMREFDLKASRKFFVYNGALECRFLKYEIF